jgi:hypothetical protein
MAKETRIVFNSAGFRDILLSDGVRDVVTNTAEEIKEKANANNTRGGNGFTANIQVGGYGGGRWVGFVTASDNKASLAESEDQALTRALS